MILVTVIPHEFQLDFSYSTQISWRSQLLHTNLIRFVKTDEIQFSFIDRHRASELTRSISTLVFHWNKPFGKATAKIDQSLYKGTYGSVVDLVKRSATNSWSLRSASLLVTTALSKDYLCKLPARTYRNFPFNFDPAHFETFCKMNTSLPQSGSIQTKMSRQNKRM